MAHSDETQKLLRCFKERLTLDEVRALVDRGADLTAVDDEGNTPLHEAVRFATTGAAALLIERGAPLEGVNASRERPIDIAIHRPPRNARAFIPILLAAGADTSHLIAKDVPKELRDLFPALPTKRRPSSIRVPGTDRAGLDAWVDAAREFIGDGGSWRHFDPTTRLEVAWKAFLLHEKWEGTHLVSFATRLRELPKGEQRAVEERFRQHWVSILGAPPAEPEPPPLDRPAAIAAVRDLVAKADRAMQGDDEFTGDVDPVAALQCLGRARAHLAGVTAEDPAALSRALETLDRAVRLIETNDEIEDTLGALLDLAGDVAALGSISGTETT